MKATLNIADAHGAFVQLNRFTPSRTSLPVLGMALLAVHDGELTASATDLDSWVTVTIPCTDALSGEAVIPVAAAMKLLAKLPKDGAVTLELGEDSRIVIAHGEARYTMYGLGADEFPMSPNMDGETSTVDVPIDTFISWAETLPGFASSEESRPILNGILFERLEPEHPNGSTREDASTLNVVATNGHRLYAERFETDGTGRIDAIVHAAFMHKAARFAAKAARKGGAETASLTFGASRSGTDGNTVTEAAPPFLRVLAPPFEMFARLIEGPYPNYRQVVPQPFNPDTRAEMIADSKALADALTAAGFLASDSTRRVKWTLNGDVTLECKAPDAGYSEVPFKPLELRHLENGTELPANADAEFVFGMNADYAVAILGALRTDTVRIRLETPERAVRFDPDGVGYGTRYAICMPLRLLD